MKNITLKIDDGVYRRARIQAARRGTSVSGMVREFLVSLESEEADREARRIAALEEMYRLSNERARKAQSVAGLHPSLKPLTREELYGDRVR